jgi:hypothetical protein
MLVPSYLLNVYASQNENTQIDIHGLVLLIGARQKKNNQYRLQTYSMHKYLISRIEEVLDQKIIRDDCRNKEK